jgi:hypothetical protein
MLAVIRRKARGASWRLVLVLWSGLAQAEPAPAFDSCAAMSEADRFVVRKKGECFGATEQALAIAALHRLLLRLLFLQRREEPLQEPDSSVVFRHEVRDLAHAAGKLAAKTSHAELLALLSAPDPYSRRFAAQALGHMLETLRFGYARGRAMDDARLALVRRPVGGACAALLADYDDGVLVTVLDFCIKTAGVDDGGGADRLFEILLQHPSDRVKVAAAEAFIRIARDDWDLGGQKVRRLVPLLCQALPKRWNHEGLRWRQLGCRILAGYMQPQESWGKGALLRAALEVRSKDSQAAEVCQSLADGFAGSGLPAEAIPAPAEVEAPPEPPVPTLPLSPKPVITLAMAAPVSFQTSRPPVPLVLYRHDAETFVVAPNGKWHIIDGMRADKTSGPILRLPGGAEIEISGALMRPVAFARDSGRVVLMHNGVSVVELPSGKTLLEAVPADAAAFVGGDGKQLVYVTDSDGRERGHTYIFRLDDPFTDVPRLVYRSQRRFYGARFVDSGRTLLLGSPDDNSILRYDVQSGRLGRWLQGIDLDSLMTSFNGTRVCFLTLAAPDDVECVRLNDGRRERIARYVPVALDARAEHMLLQRGYGFEVAYALADFVKGTITPLRGVRLHPSAGVSLTADGLAVTSGAESFFEYFDIPKRKKYRLAGQGFFTTKPIEGMPHATGVGGANDTNFDLFLFAPP